MRVISESNRYVDGKRILTQEVEYDEAEDLRSLSQVQNALAYQIELLAAAGDAETKQKLEASVAALRARQTSLTDACAGYHT